MKNHPRLCQRPKAKRHKADASVSRRLRNSSSSEAAMSSNATWTWRKFVKYLKEWTSHSSKRSPWLYFLYLPSKTIPTIAWIRDRPLKNREWRLRGPLHGANLQGSKVCSAGNFWKKYKKCSYITTQIQNTMVVSSRLRLYNKTWCKSDSTTFTCSISEFTFQSLDMWIISAWMSNILSTTIIIIIIIIISITNVITITIWGNEQSSHVTSLFSPLILVILWLLQEPEKHWPFLKPVQMVTWDVFQPLPFQGVGRHQDDPICKKVLLWTLLCTLEVFSNNNPHKKKKKRGNEHETTTKLTKP